MSKLYDFGSRGIVVMDGKRTVATAKKWRSPGVWQLRLYDGSWADCMTNEARIAHYKRIGLSPDYAANLKTVPTRREALRIMKDLAR